MMVEAVSIVIGGLFSSSFFPRSFVSIYVQNISFFDVAVHTFSQEKYHLNQIFLSLASHIGYIFKLKVSYIVYRHNCEILNFLTNLNVVSQWIAFGMNLDKVMFNGHVVPRPFTVDGITLEVISEYTYLGQFLKLGRNSFEKEVERKIQLA